MSKGGGTGVLFVLYPVCTMAEQALKKLEDQLNCPICLETYTDPKQLQCQHVYCQQCLVKLLVIRDQQGLTCPNCRQVTPVPAKGVEDLQAAFQISQFLEIVKEHKKAKNASASTELIASASASPTPHGNITVVCPEHGGRKVTLYCETCGETICYRCTKKGERHHGHDYQELDEAFEKYQGEIASSLEPMEKQLATIERALKQLDVHSEEVSNQRETVEVSIHETIKRLHQTLDARKTELINQLHQLTQAKLKSLAVQRDQMETTQAQLSSCLHFMRENLKTCNQEEALMMKSTTIRQVEELITTFQPDVLEPNTEADMTFSALADITAVIQNYGRVHEKCSPDPSKCITTGKGMEVAAVEEKYTALLQTLDRPSKKRETQREISYQSTIKGKDQLKIKVEGRYTRGSPLAVTLVKPSTPIVGMRRPEGVAVNQRGEVVVTEKDGHCVSVFSPGRKRLRSFGTQGSGQGQFEYPYGVAVDGNGCILVTDRNNHRIQKFSAEGKFLTAVGTEGSGPLQFRCPQGIAYNASNDKVYVGDVNCRIQILNSNLSYVSSFGKAGSDQGQFDGPQHLACDSNGNVYVADCHNHCVQVFTAKGKFLRMFGRHGEGKGELKGPSGLAIDSSDRVYVSEWNNHRVSEFTSEGQFLTSFGREGSAPGQFRGPSGLAVESGVLYICDYRNNCVHILF